MKSISKITSSIAAVGAGALGIGLISLGTGVGAQFTGSGNANANIKTGTFDCTLSSTDSRVLISNSGHTATVDLGTIDSSAPSSSSAPVTVTNTGSIPLATTWTETTTGNILGGSGAISVIAPAGGTQLGAGTAQTVNIGFTWTELQSSDLNRSGTAKYTVSCNEVGATAGFELFQQSGGEASWDSQTSQAALDIPTGTATPVAAGINILNVPATLPTNAPVFVTDNYGAGTPRLAIEFSDGGYAFGYPAQASPPSNWTLPGSGTPTTWAAVQSYATTHSLTVVNAFVVADNSNGTGVVSHISCLDYSGTPLFGSC